MFDEMCRDDSIQNRQLSDELSLMTGVLIYCQSRIQALPRRKAEEVQ